MDQGLSGRTVSLAASSAAVPTQQSATADQARWFKERLEPSISWYDNKAGRHRVTYFALRLLSLLAASAITVVSIINWTPFGWPGTWLPGLLGASIVLLEGLQGLFHARDQWLSYRATAEALKREKWLFFAQAGTYATVDRATAFAELASRTEQLIEAENTTWRRVHERANDQPKPPIEPVKSTV